jgi:hypothetical protein
MDGIIQRNVLNLPHNIFSSNNKILNIKKSLINTEKGIASFYWSGATLKALEENV